MAGDTTIEWTNKTWNPIRGCSRVSLGCINCYAERMAARLSSEGASYDGLVERTSDGPRWTNKAVMVEAALNQPRRWKKPQVIFVNSMSDMFHEQIIDDDIRRIFDVMNENDRHTYQILTKRSERLLKMADQLPWSDNIWMGVSVESSKFLNRIDHLRSVPARYRFISAEPLLGPLGKFDTTGIDWIIAGGESGPRARACHPDWVREIRDHCTDNEVMFHFKQWGGVTKKKYGRTLDGRTHDEMPEIGDNSKLKKAA